MDDVARLLVNVCPIDIRGTLQHAQYVVGKRRLADHAPIPVLFIQRPIKPSTSVNDQVVRPLASRHSPVQPPPKERPNENNRMLLISGDGAFGLNGMELETAVRFKLPFTCVIGNDGGWGQIRSPQVSFFGEARTVATSLPNTRYDRMVEALGGRGAYVTDPREIGPALERALASDEVWCVNVVLDPAAYRRTGTVSMAI